MPCMLSLCARYTLCFALCMSSLGLVVFRSILKLVCVRRAGKFVCYDNFAELACWCILVNTYVLSVSMRYDSLCA